MILFVQSPPFEPAHLALYICKHIRDPVDYTVEICFQLDNVLFFAVTTHIIANIAFAYPIQRTFQKILSVSATRYIRTPFLDIGVLAITKLLLTECYKWPGIH